MSAIRLASVSLDCPDPGALASFYGALLNTEVAYHNDAFAALRLGQMWLTMQRIDRYRAPVWPEGDPAAQIHLDRR